MSMNITELTKLVEELDYEVIHRKTLEKLLFKAEMYDCLREVGVDNWEGYIEAIYLYDGYETSSAD